MPASIMLASVMRFLNREEELRRLEHPWEAPEGGLGARCARGSRQENG